LGGVLNPRFGSFDLKFFFESRPGLIGWLVLDLCFLFEERWVRGEWTAAMFLVVGFQCLYVVDFFANEEKILTTWDIKHERLGWMLLWGCLVWVPFVFSLQAHYLLHRSAELSLWAILGVIALNTVGYIIFRGANSQKHRFRKNPDAYKPTDYIRTAQGSVLLTSGWWGLARHINYLGDLMMALAWCLPCGFGSPLPYFYFVYFLILLIHRERRDHAACRAKYGTDWDAYCRKVPWRIVPYVY
jgi:protein-S-isoprenylcysteine O-methyltransferase Ste14